LARFISQNIIKKAKIEKNWARQRKIEIALLYLSADFEFETKI
jgi:hypothetical protein